MAFAPNGANGGTEDFLKLDTRRYNLGKREECLNGAGRMEKVTDAFLL